ncbi:OmpH family outer membrane protein [Flavobacterium sp.]|uniref:OmpH family outer membrane protein n=1 Tax=Flavobacterium sp. TaxID=239 RepID=UPI0037BFF056
MLLVLLGLKLQAQQVYIYKDSLVVSAKGYVAKKASLDSVQKVYTEEVQNFRTKAQENYTALVTPYAPKEGETIEQLKARMSAIDAEKLTLLQEEDKLLETRIKSYNSQLEQQYNRDLKPIMDTIDAVIATYAKKNKIDFVFVMEELAKSLAYVNKGKNITGVISELVNKELGK